MSDQVLLTTKPDLLRSHAIATAFLPVALIVGIGGAVAGGEGAKVVSILAWITVFVTACLLGGFWWGCFTTTLTVNADRTILRKGILDKVTTEVRHKDVRLTTIREPFPQEFFRVGTVEISTAGHAGIEITVRGIRNPERIRKLIDDGRE